MADYWHLFIGALFLRREVYEYQRDRKNPFAHGLLFIALIGAAVAVAGILGAILRYAFSPSADAIKNIVLNHLQAMPFYTQLAGTPAEQQFLTGYNQTWANAGNFFVGYPISSAGWAQTLATVVTTPVALMLGWIIYGALASLIASRGAAHVPFAHVLGTLALTTAPQALSIVNLFPSAGVSSVAIFVWSLIADVVALQTAYQIKTTRAIWAALFPFLLLLLLLILFGCAAYVLLIGLIGGARS